MAAMEEIPIPELPEKLFEAIVQDLAHYSVGFVRVKDTPRGQDATLLGSGTCVTIGQTRAILTAHHVVKLLPQSGRLGLILSPNLQQYTVDTQGLVYREIARGMVDSEGPDLGALICASSIGAAIAAKKTFYNLELRREQLLHTPLDLENGVWFVHGFVDEKTWEEPGGDRYSLIKGFYNLSGAGAPEPPFSVGEHDYFAFPVGYGGQSVAPMSFGGMSGGGLWQVPILRDEQGNLRHTTPLLSGVVFYQEPIAENRCTVKCHGRRSVYGAAYDAIQGNGP